MGARIMPEVEFRALTVSLGTPSFNISRACEINIVMDQSHVLKVDAKH